jgi:hypothetical protein
MISATTGRVYDPLPIDNAAGFPQQLRLLLNGVRYQIGLYVDAPEATLGSLPVNSTTNGASPAGSSILHFAAVPAGVFIGMTIADLTAGPTIPAGTTVQAKTATTVAMSQSASGAEVGAGDRIQFTNELMALPDPQRFLVARVDVLAPDGTAQTVFLRKVVPSLEYRAGGLGLYFPTQIVARRNLNGVGNFGSNVVGWVAQL